MNEVVQDVGLLSRAATKIFLLMQGNFSRTQLIRHRFVMLSDDRPAYFHRYSAKIFRSRDEYRVSSFYTKIIATYNSRKIPLQWLASILHLFPYALVFN